MVSFPKEIVQRQSQRLADTDTQANGGVIVTIFDGVDGLAGNPQMIRQLLLGHPLLLARLPHGVILPHFAPLSGSAATR